jgi:soluble lytic murein transglycosylase
VTSSTIRTVLLGALLCNTAILVLPGTASAQLNLFQGQAAEQAPTGGTVSRDALRAAIAAAEAGNTAEVDQRLQGISDPAARSLVEWFLIRAGSAGVSSQRAARFLTQNPGWPQEGTLRNRAEQALLNERRPAAEVIAFFRNGEPRSAPGRVALASALIASGDTANAHRQVRQAWRGRDLSLAAEQTVRERFPGVITRADEMARLDRLLYGEDTAAALRVATRIGGSALVKARARIAVINKAGNAGALLEAVPAEARSEPGYMFHRIQWLRRNDRPAEAARLMVQAPRDPRVLVDPDEWWTERRLLARRMIDEGDPQIAYRIASGHSAQRDVEKMEAEFTAGWIALRFLNDPNTADRHFQALQAEASRKISVARAAYWRGRAAEARGAWDARQHFEAAARFPTTYYGQLAAAKLGQTELALRGPRVSDESGRARLEARPMTRAIRLLSSAGLGDKARPFFVQLSETLNEPDEVAALARIGEQMGQHRFALLAGKGAAQRGIAVDHIAFPTGGLPSAPVAGPPIERAVVLAIARQESTFDPNARSTAGALGLLQLMPGTAAATARRFGVQWRPGALTDPVYNTTLGTAHLGELSEALNGSYVLTFAAYNAGKSRVREWIARYGDPRTPGVDVVDWVERIPFSETRNYVMRVMENLQVYRARLQGSQAALMIERDLRRGRPGSVE